MFVGKAFLTSGTREKLVKYLDNLPPGEVKSTKEVEQELGIRVSNYDYMSSNFAPELQERTIIYNNKRWWANKQTVELFNQELQEIKKIEKLGEKNDCTRTS